VRTKRGIKIQERRKKRKFIPVVYFIVEITLVWLILSIIHVDFNIAHWDKGSIFIFVIIFIYSILKTLHIYERQKDYPED